MNKQEFVFTPSGSTLPKLPDMTANSASGNPTIQYPGQRAGLTLEQVKKFNREYALKCKGFYVSVPADIKHEININISGEAWAMLGFIVCAITNFASDVLAPKALSLMVNEEQVVNSKGFVATSVKYYDGLYYPFERYLAGQDVITLTIDNTGRLEQDITIDFYWK